MSSRRVQVGFDAQNPVHAGSAACCNIIFNGVMAYFFYTYAWANPDLAKHGACWANDGTDYGTPTSSDLLGGGAREDVSKQF